MGFPSKQVAALRRNVDQRHIRVRQSNGRELSYLEGWYVISQANRIFGFDGWSRETLESKCVLSRENRGYFTAVYTAKVRLTVQANGAIIVREGHGTGEPARYMSALLRKQQNCCIGTKRRDGPRGDMGANCRVVNFPLSTSAEFAASAVLTCRLAAGVRGCGHY